MTVTLSFDLSATGIPANRKLLGSNLQWRDQGDHMIQTPVNLAKTYENDWKPTYLAYAKAMAPTVLRYPGGTLADLFHWNQTLGNVSTRTNQLSDTAGSTQRPDFGLLEHLALCRQCAAEPVFTVNLPTALANEGRDWVTKTNVTGLTAADGFKYQAVKYWEIGNEPYLLHSGHAEYDLTPAQTIALINPIVSAMRTVDPSIKIGIPIHSDQFSAYPLGIQGYNTTVLAGLTQNVDWAALHTAYFPFLWNPAETYTLDDLYRVTMAAYRHTSSDMDTLRTTLDANSHTAGAKFAMTEYQAIYSLGGAVDTYPDTLGGAMYCADVLRLLASRSDVLFACMWSLSENFVFGAISSTGQLRPQAAVLGVFSDLLHGTIVSTTQTGGTTQASPLLGVVAAFSDTPTLASIVSYDGQMVKVLLINRDPVNAQTVALNPSGAPTVMNETMQTFGDGISTFDTTERTWVWNPVAQSSWGASPPAWPTTVPVPAHGMAYVTIQVPGNRSALTSSAKTGRWRSPGDRRAA